MIVASGDGTVLSQGRGTLAAGARAVVVDVGAVASAGGDLVVRTRIKPRGEGAVVTDSTSVSSVALSTAAPLLWRRGPSTQMRFMPTADTRFTRADRVRADVLLADATSTVTAILLDRVGATIAVPVTAGSRTEGAMAWGTAELALAPLAPSEYVLKITVDRPGRAVRRLHGDKGRAMTRTCEAIRTTITKARRHDGTTTILGLAAFVAVFAVYTAGSRAQEKQQPLPRFRGGASLVRVDAYPTSKGQAVKDLTAADFEVFEDGAPQKVESFELVEVRAGGPQEARREPNTVREAQAMAEEARARIFVIYLDTYFTDIAGSHRIQRSLVNLIDRVVGDDDLFAVMTPDMSARDLALARRSTTMEGYCRSIGSGASARGCTRRIRWSSDTSSATRNAARPGHAPCLPTTPRGSRNPRTSTRASPPR